MIEWKSRLLMSCWMRRSFTARRCLVWRFREVGTRRRCESKRRYDTSRKLNALKSQPDVFFDIDIFGRCFIKTDDVCFFSLGWRGTIETTVVSCYVSSQRLAATAVEVGLQTVALPRVLGASGGMGVRLRQDGDEDFPEKMPWPKKVHSLDDSSQWCLVGRIFFFGVFLPQNIFT